MLETAATQQPSPSHSDHGSEDEQMARAMIEIQHILDSPSSPPYIISDDDDEDDDGESNHNINVESTAQKMNKWYAP